MSNIAARAVEPEPLHVHQLSLVIRRLSVLFLSRSSKTVSQSYYPQVVFFVKGFKANGKSPKVLKDVYEAVVRRQTILTIEMVFKS